MKVMDKAKIAIDLDKTIVDSSSLIYRLANFVVGKSRGGSNLKYLNLTKERVKPSRLRRVLPVFNSKNYYEVENATEYLKKWHESGAEIYVVSSRPDWRPVRAMTEEWIDSNQLENVCSVVINCNNKPLFCKLNGIGTLVDDSENVCRLAKNYGINAIHFSKRASGELPRVSSWQQLDQEIGTLLMEEEDCDGRENL